MAAPRLIVPPMALLLVVAVVLSRLQASIPAELPGEPLGAALIPKTRTGNAKSSARPAASSSCKDVGHEGPTRKGDKEHKDDKEKEEEREKRKEEDKEVEKEAKEYGKEHELVSPTHGKGYYKGMAREFVDAHNEVRARYGVPPVKWDRKLVKHARRYANKMRKNCQLQHSSTRYGESIFLSHDDWNATATEAVHWWGTEESIYNPSTGKCTGDHQFSDCGHFALIVGKRYQRLGCARSECVHGGVFVICNYYTYDLKDPDRE